MERVASEFDFSKIEKIMFGMGVDHSASQLNKLKTELNTFFPNAKCKEIIYTNNTDKLFFGMRVYPNIDGNDAIEIVGDSKTKPFKSYYLEFDSKLFDDMLGLDEKEYTAILLHEIGHIVYDTETIDEVRRQLDMYFAQTDEHVNLRASKGYRELLAYALKDSVMKVGSAFTKIGNTEIIADSFVAACGYGPYLESGMRKIARSTYYLNRDIDNRLITLSWVIRLGNEFNIRRLPSIKTLNKAKQLTGSKLENRELTYAVNTLSHMDDPMEEASSGLDNVKARFSNKFKQFKLNGIRALKNDVYEFNLRLRCAESEEDLALLIRNVNSDIAILEDYLSEEMPDDERQSVLDALEQLYDIRQRAAKDKRVQSSYASIINVVYPE